MEIAEFEFLDPHVQFSFFLGFQIFNNVGDPQNYKAI